MGNSEAILIKRNKVYLLMTLIVIVVTGVYIFLFMNYDKTIKSTLSKTVDKNAPPTFRSIIYGGFGEDALDKPMDLAVIGQFIYTTDTNNKRVQVFDLGGTPVAKFGKDGDGPGEFKFPYGIAGDKEGRVYVADLYNGSISILDSKGKFIKYFAEKKPSEKILEAPGGLRIIDDKVYVTDIQKNKFLVFDMSGKKLLEIGKMGLNPGEFRAPNAITADKEGNIYVVDTGNQRVQVFDKKGKLKKIFNGSLNGKGTSSFVNPRGIGIDSRGIVYVVSNVTHFIYGFDKNGKQLFSFGGSGEENEKFTLPNGLFVDENDQVYISDTMNRRLAIYN